MTDTAINLLKRSHTQDDEITPQKKSRSNDGSPRPDPNGAAPPVRTDITKMLAEAGAQARAKAEAAKAKVQAARGGFGGTTTPTPAAGSAQDRLAQLKARVASATGKVGTISQLSPSTTLPAYPPPPFDEGVVRARGGLDVGLHPALMGDLSTQEIRKGKTPGGVSKAPLVGGQKLADSRVQATRKKAQLDLSAPSAEEIKSNPYFDSNLASNNVTGASRHSRKLIFNQKGKYIQQAAALKRQAQLEAMKKRISEQARKAGIEEELDAEKAFVVSAPPAVEWWDEGLMKGDSYEAISDPANLKIDTNDSIITIYIQHPVLLEPPQEKIVPAPKPIYLTSKQQAKVRRQRRMADHKDQQAKVRLGLEPAPPPKVSTANLMRVLGEEAVRDPTAVEARVNRDVAERKHKHEELNRERKLTDTRRHEKLATQQQGDAAKGIFTTVYRIDSLANGRHRYKISVNAEQNALTGVCIMHPKMNLVIVEGGWHSVRAYKKVMLNRIDWTENAGPNSVREGNKEALAKWLEAEDEKGGLKDLTFNACQLVFEGEEKNRAFRKWLGARVCESDTQAKDILARAKMEGFWNLAKSLKKID